MASWLVRSTPERAVWIRALAGDIREFKQIAPAVADTAAGSKFPPRPKNKMIYCACTSVASSRSAKSDYVKSGCFAVVATTLALYRFSGPFQRTSRHFKSSIGYYIL